MTLVYLVRHGEVDNPKDILYGRLPGFHLTKKGKQQAEKLGLLLRQQNIRSIYASPLERTRETAEIIADALESTVKVKLDERLLETSSTLEGAPFVTIRRMNGNVYQEKYLKNGGETISVIWDRMSDFFKEKVSLHQGESIVVVSHGDPIQIARLGFRGKSLVFRGLKTDYLPRGQCLDVKLDKHGVCLSMKRLRFD